MSWKAVVFRDTIRLADKAPLRAFISGGLNGHLNDDAAAAFKGAEPRPLADRHLERLARPLRLWIVS